jgi:hypothetical protein
MQQQQQQQQQASGNQKESNSAKWGSRSSLKRALQAAHNSRAQH